jgi:hypothetical protein
MVWNQSEVEVVGNTLISAKLLWLSNGGDIQCHGNIFFGCPVALRSFDGGDIYGNDVWPDSFDVGGEFQFRDNVFKDPLFCGPEAGDFSIADESPCAEPNSPGECGLVGALEPSCRLTTRRRMTWGQIKGRFHGR